MKQLMGDKEGKDVEQSGALPGIGKETRAQILT
jgi:hypothetical protein